ncbi:MAG: metallophosphoesterase, partial [Phaeodactylibacter sp.]|nr:metallophosphoesterase [Phaeodactylibacter sp.]
MRKNVYTIVSVCVILCIGVLSHAQTIIRGPYLQIGTPNSMTIRWRTDDPTSTKVWYGPSPGNLPFTNTVGGSRTEHEVTISGLAANSVYYYAVGNSSGQLTSPSSNHYFKTSPTPGTQQTIRAWVLGDCGTGDNNQRAVRDAFYDFNGSQHIDMMLLLGDNAYDDGTDEEFQAAFFENMYEDRLINTVMWPAIGNHETITADSETESGPYYDIFNMPRNGEAGGVPSGTEAYYSFDYGNIHFIVLDSDDSGRDPGDPQLVWLENDLNNTDQDWIVAYWHHPPYSKDGESDTNGKETTARENFLPILESHNVDLVLVGHSHNWQRSYLIHGHYGLQNSWNPATMGIDLGDGRLDGDGAYSKNTLGQGTVYIVSGSAGKKTGSISNPHPVMYHSQADYGSMYLEVTGGQMDIQFIRDNGDIDDYLTIVKQLAVGNPPTVSVTSPANGFNYSTPQQINIKASASDSDGSVTKVEFFINNFSIGVDNSAPYSINYTIPNEGDYTITAAATDNDGNVTLSSPVLFTVGPVTVCSLIDNSTDDVEQRTDNGRVDLTNGDLEMIMDGVRPQIVGLRFNNLNIPQGANIASAYIQFTVDEETNINPCNLTISGVAADNAGTFTSSDYSVSNLPKTSASVSWTPSDWPDRGARGPAQQTPNINTIIQEIVNRPGFSATSSISILIEGEGARVAESFDGAAGADKFPELCIEWSTAPINYDCPNLLADIGTPCDDGDNTTLNDMVDDNCDCTGTPTACTGIGDADGDGVCADVDCDDLDPDITHRPGDACDDGNLTTINDVYDANCNCVGTLNPCTGIGDNDGDGICADIDCDDNDPNNTSIAGDACDDGDNTTLNDILDANCNCVGTPTACTGIGDMDGDGVCADIDCNDNDPNNLNYPGAPCDDGNPNTYGETIQSDCGCGGGIPSADFTCVQINIGSDDAEERSGRVDLSSSDLELANDPNLGSQVIGMRFNGLNIPQGAVITNAFIQFTSDENRNENPCNLMISGEASDNASPFSEANDTDISSRPRTTATVSWFPPEWENVGIANAAQRTPNLAAVLQEIVSRNGYSSSSSIILIVEGSGARTAESFEGNPFGAPQLCVAYTIPFDCPALQANTGDACDDGDNTTLNDMVDANCNCTGTPTACTGIGDVDGDGVCADVDCDDDNAAITSVDVDGDGVCSDVDCDDNDPLITGPRTWYADNDGDGYGDPNNNTQACFAPAGYTADKTDCDDNDPNEFPGQTWFLDADGDGYSDGSSRVFCTRPAGHYTAAELAQTAGDCDDGNAAVNPGAAEACNGIDDNCDTQVDEGVQSTFYADTDGDGYEDPNNTTQACSAPAGYTADNTDCNDGDASEFPGQTWSPEERRDGNECSSRWAPYPRPASHYTAAELAQTAGDCDDGNAAINPGAAEACNGIDDNCDTQVDENITLQDYYFDADGDGY